MFSKSQYHLNKCLPYFLIHLSLRFNTIFSTEHLITISSFKTKTFSTALVLFFPELLMRLKKKVMESASATALGYMNLDFNQNK